MMEREFRRSLRITERRPYGLSKLFLCILAIFLMIFVTSSLTIASEGDGIIEPGENRITSGRTGPCVFRCSVSSPKADSESR